MPPTTTTAEIPLGVTHHDASAFEELFTVRLDSLDESGLDPETYSPATVAALIASDAAPASSTFPAALALDAGVTPRRCWGCWSPGTRRSATSPSCPRRQRSPSLSGSSPTTGRCESDEERTSPTPAPGLSQPMGPAWGRSGSQCA